MRPSLGVFGNCDPTRTCAAAWGCGGVAHGGCASDTRSIHHNSVHPVDCFNATPRAGSERPVVPHRAHRPPTDTPAQTLHTHQPTDPDGDHCPPTHVAHTTASAEHPKMTDGSRLLTSHPARAGFVKSTTAKSAHLPASMLPAAPLSAVCAVTSRRLCVRGGGRACCEGGRQS